MLPDIFVSTIIRTQIEFDTGKRDRTLAERGLDFARAAEVFAGPTVTLQDTRQDYGEPRFITVGALDGRMEVLAWTQRGERRRIISMRKANEREQAQFNLG
ncbi:BrnT family toxin [Paraburkholderia denitrificans]|uniref:BrnT family toxin n=1 Tax=Paraburkholderia denitrificans TaxID=694025 RepID=A0ABW0JDP1_9BURK